MPMNKTTTLVFSHLIAFILAYVLGTLSGYVFQRPRITALQNEKVSVVAQKEQVVGELGDARSKIQQLEYRLRIAGVLDQLTMLHLELVSNNYGKAASISSQFFDGLRRLEEETKDQDLKLRLGEALKSRDEITAQIARADNKVTAKVKWFLVDLHEGAEKYAR